MATPLHSRAPVMIRFILGASFISLALVLSACDKFEYSPYQTDSANKPSDLNNRNINELFANDANADDTVRFIFTGDSQRFYDELQDLVNKANSLPKIDFLILAGDISDFGLLQEFIWVNEELEGLNFPYFAAIGNHDLTANGSVVYTSMFGPKNYSFSYKKHKFIFHDTNSREYNFNGYVPDVQWLGTQLKDSTANWFIGVSHVPPYDVDFDKKLEMPYKDQWASNSQFILSLHGHLHTNGDSFFYEDHVRYINVTAVGQREFMLIELVNGKIKKQMVPY